MPRNIEHGADIDVIAVEVSVFEYPSLDLAPTGERTLCTHLTTTFRTR